MLDSNSNYDRVVNLVKKNRVTIQWVVASVVITFLIAAAALITGAFGTAKSVTNANSLTTVTNTVHAGFPMTQVTVDVQGACGPLETPIRLGKDGYQACIEVTWFVCNGSTNASSAYLVAELPDAYDTAPFTGGPFSGHYVIQPATNEPSVIISFMNNGVSGLGMAYIIEAIDPYPPRLFMQMGNVFAEGTTPHLDYGPYGGFQICYTSKVSSFSGASSLTPSTSSILMAGLFGVLAFVYQH